MKRLLKKILEMAGLARSAAGPLKVEEFQQRSAKEVFTLIHDRNYWNSAESVSGTGSEVGQAAALIEELPALFKSFGITSMLDIPCGDFNWMKEVDLSGVRYIGGDIVEALVEANKERFKQRPELEFRVVDLIADPLPTCDLVMVRYCLVHLSFADIERALGNIRASGAKYLLATTFTEHPTNTDIVTGDWRPLNLQRAPLNLPAPVQVIDERCLEANGRYCDKVMALWDLRTF
jgi:SAM-dependent methyltransferase